MFLEVTYRKYVKKCTFFAVNKVLKNIKY